MWKNRTYCAALAAACGVAACGSGGSSTGGGSSGTSSSGGSGSGGSSSGQSSGTASSSGTSVAPTNLTLKGDATNGVPSSTVTSVTCNPGKNVTFSFPTSSRYTGLGVFLVWAPGSSSARIAVEGNAGLLYWAANTPQTFPQTGGGTIEPVTLTSQNSFAPGTVTITGTYACD